MRTLTKSAAHCSVMSGELVTKQAKAGRDQADAAGCLCGGGAVIGRPQRGGVATRPQLIAKLRNSRSL